MRRPLYLVLLAATLIVYGLMVFWTLPTIRDAAGGLMPFDLRLWGYDFAEADLFLKTLTDEGRALYLGAQHWLDLAYPVLLGVVLAWSITALSGAIGGTVAVVFRGVGVVAALAGMVFDLMENRAVARLLAVPETLTPQMVATASNWTVAKSGATSIAMTVLLALLVWRWLRVRGRS